VREAKGGVRCSEVLERPAVNVLPMADFHDNYHKLLVVDGVDDSIDALANPIAVAARQLLATWWTRIIGEAANPICDSLAVLLTRKRLEFLGRGRLD